MTRKNTGILGSALLLVVASIFAGNATASTVTVDGIKSAGEYAGANSGSINLLWWNDHNSVYRKDRSPGDVAGETSTMNPLDWEISGAAGNVSLNLFFEVPTYARRMIWANGCDTGSPGSVACAPLAPGGDTSYLDAYHAGTHHSGGDGMDYHTQTDSEYFRLNADPNNLNHDTNKDGSVQIVKIHWTDEKNDDKGISRTSDLTWATSTEYLVANSSNCDTTTCTEFDKTSSIELEWNNLATVAAAEAIRNSITDMQLHLSDEAVGLPPISEIPVPAAFWLFGTALIGFIGYSRRTNLG